MIEQNVPIFQTGMMQMRVKSELRKHSSGVTPLGVAHSTVLKSAVVRSV